MLPAFRSTAYFFLCALAGFAAAIPSSAQGVASVRSLRVLPGTSGVEIEIDSTAAVVPQTNELGSPNRLLVDFLNAKPGAQLRGVKVNRPEVKDLRVSQFSVDPPVTRIVVDLNSPQPYQVFPSGKTTIVKIGTAAADNAGMKPSSGNVMEAAAAAAPPPPKPTLEVSFANGLLAIQSDRASLAEILTTVHERTGAQIDVPPGTGQEEVVMNLGPASAPEVLSQLLNGSKFNFLILSSPRNPGELDQVILTPRPEGPAPVQAATAPPPEPTPAENPQPDPEERFRMRGRPGGLPPFGDTTPTTEGEGQPQPPNSDNPQ